MGGSFLGFLKKGADAVKKYVPKDVAKKAVSFDSQKVGEATGQHDLADKAKDFLHSKLDDHYADDPQQGEGFFGNLVLGARKLAGNPVVQGLAKQGLNAGLSYAANSSNPTVAGLASTAQSITGGKLKKGSEEARERMAKIRAMRGKGLRHHPQMEMDGEGTLGDLVSGAKKLASNSVVQGLTKQGLNAGLNYAAKNSNPTIAGLANTAKSITGGKLKKGSPEAREHMARIRAMRGKGFGGFFKKLGRQIKSVATNPNTLNVLKQVGQTAAPIALGLAQADPLTAGIANVASSVIPASYGGTASPPSSPQVGGSLRHRRYKNDCSTIVGGVAPPLELMGRRREDEFGYSSEVVSPAFERF